MYTCTQISLSIRKYGHIRVRGRCLYSRILRGGVLEKCVAIVASIDTQVFNLA